MTRDIVRCVWRLPFVTWLLLIFQIQPCDWSWSHYAKKHLILHHKNYLTSTRTAVLVHSCCGLHTVTIKQTFQHPKVSINKTFPAWKLAENWCQIVYKRYYLRYSHARRRGGSWDLAKYARIMICFCLIIGWIIKFQNVLVHLLSAMKSGHQATLTRNNSSPSPPFTHPLSL